MSSLLVQDAVCMRLIAIGDAVNRLSSEQLPSLPDVPWTDVVGMRHRLAHGYDQANFALVWDVVSGRDLDDVERAIRELVERQDARSL